MYSAYYPECTISSWQVEFCKKISHFFAFFGRHTKTDRTPITKISRMTSGGSYMCWWDLGNILKSLTMLLALLNIAKLQELREKARKKRKFRGMFKEPPFDEIENVSWEISQMLWPTYVVYSCQAAILRSVSSMNQSLVKTDKNYLGNCYFARHSYIPTNANRFCWDRR